MPTPSALLVRLLWDAARAGNGAIPTGPRGIEPLFGFYPRGIARRLSRDLRTGKNIPIHRLARLSGIRRIPWRLVRRVDPDGDSFANLNRPGEIAEFRHGARRATVPPERR